MLGNFKDVREKSRKMGNARELLGENKCQGKLLLQFGSHTRMWYHSDPCYRTRFRRSTIECYVAYVLPVMCLNCVLTVVNDIINYRMMKYYQYFFAFIIISFSHFCINIRL